MCVACVLVEKLSRSRYAVMQSLFSSELQEVHTEKSELIDAILAAGGSSHCTCAVCYEDYQDGDIMRVRLIVTGYRLNFMGRFLFLLLGRCCVYKAALVQLCSIIQRRVTFLSVSNKFPAQCSRPRGLEQWWVCTAPFLPYSPHKIDA